MKNLSTVNRQFKIVLLVSERSWYVMKLLERTSKDRNNVVLLLLKQHNVNLGISSINNNLKAMGLLWTSKKLLLRLFVIIKFLKYRSIVYQVKSFNEIQNISGVDLAIAYNTGIINENVFKYPQFGTICAHPAYLPYGRGIAGSDQAILKNDPVGVTIFKINDGIDTGDIFYQEKINIDNLFSYPDLSNNLSNLSLNLTLKTVNAIKRGIKPKKQDNIMPYIKLTLSQRKKAMILWQEVFIKNKKRLK